MIKIDMEMPRSCAECDFLKVPATTDYFQCIPDGRYMYDEDKVWMTEQRPKWCPLKEQEAKVLTVDQLEDALDTVVWLETPVSENLSDGYSLIMAYSHKYGYMFFDSPFGDNPSQDRLEYSEYGKSWRCWDKRPTDKQRKAVKWE